MGEAIAAYTFAGLGTCFLIAVGIALTKKRHAEGRSMWEKTDAPWYFLKRNRGDAP